MKKVKVTGQTKKSGSSKAKSGSQPTDPEPNRRGRRAEEGQPLKRLLVFLSERDITALRKKVGDKRGVSTKVREIIKEWLAR